MLSQGEVSPPSQARSCKEEGRHISLWICTAGKQQEMELLADREMGAPPAVLHPDCPNAGKHPSP